MTIISPYLNLVKHPEAIGDMMFSGLSIDKMEDRPCDFLIPMEENPRVKQLKTKERFYLDKDGKSVSKSEALPVKGWYF